MIVQPTLLSNEYTPRVRKTFCFPSGCTSAHYVSQVLGCSTRTRFKRVGWSVGRSVSRSMSRSVEAIETRREQYGIWLGPHLESLGALLTDVSKSMSRHISPNNFGAPLKGPAFVSAVMALFREEESSRMKPFNAAMLTDLS